MSAVHSGKFYKASLPFKALRFFGRILFRLMFRIKVEGRHNLPHEGGYIIAGNHLSWIDSFLILAFCPSEPRIFFIAAREEVYFPRWRRIFTEKVGGVIAIDRDKGLSRELIEKVRETLEGGGVLGIFPEGDVSAIETGRILPLKRGMGMFAGMSGVPIVPVGFSGTKELWLGKRLRMTIGVPIPGEKGGKDITNKQTEITAKAIAAMLTPPPHIPDGPKILRKFLTELFTQEVKEHPIPD
ncbi:MAG: 1-acyl-sn-glycerol-3-phosphate acyltransferase [Chloroflexi bacterium]|uniref:1-acyl-sn-glycerol-3-phosphate acyltransferase n=1 Tax=Candidatus Chlorohelix allophototropha TaxID=3003348 RepID=A0A8T7M3B0_9CHLR|nr:1-acyl-sn-glycerol-3-phosphate acyltransferase [Chloroflexota bacterium]WJW65677.1 1-acyl-sn-glycerol-3-phosphate acyltransferase [Chloroflexota bacterium L227-S17]